MSEEQRQSSKLLEPRSFDVHKNATVPMIAMLGCLELDTEISDIGMETVESDDCREMSEDNRDMNNLFSDFLDVCVMIYLNNILIYSNNMSEHCWNIKAGLYAKAEKRKFYSKLVEYLGYILSLLVLLCPMTKLRFFKTGQNLRKSRMFNSSS